MNDLTSLLHNTPGQLVHKIKVLPFRAQEHYWDGLSIRVRLRMYISSQPLISLFPSPTSAKGCIKWLPEVGWEGDYTLMSTACAVGQVQIWVKLNACIWK